MKRLSSWNTTYVLSTKQDNLFFLRSWLIVRLKVTPTKYMLVHGAKPVTFLSLWVSFLTCFCLVLEITGNTLMLPTKASLTYSFFFSVVNLASLENIHLCYFYTYWKRCVQEPKVTQPWQREVAFAWGEREVGGSRCRWGLLSVWKQNLGLLWYRRETSEKILAVGFCICLWHCSYW